MILVAAALTGLLVAMSPIDPQKVHPGAPRATFALSGYDFSSAEKTTRVPYARLAGKAIEVHFAFKAPITGRCELFELVTMNGIKGVAYPWGDGEGRTAIAGHTIRVDLALHTDAELAAAGMTRDKPTIGMDCWAPHDERATVFSTLYQLSEQQPSV